MHSARPTGLVGLSLAALALLVVPTEADLWALVDLGAEAGLACPWLLGGLPVLALFGAAKRLDLRHARNLTPGGRLWIPLQPRPLPGVAPARP